MTKYIKEFIGELREAVSTSRDLSDMVYNAGEVMDIHSIILSLHEKDDIKRALRQLVYDVEFQLVATDELYDWLWKEVEERLAKQ